MLKLEKIPVPLLPTMVGACTLSNVYFGLGFSYIKDFFMILSTIILILYTFKIILKFEVCKKEYSQTVPCSLYAGFTMLIMILSSYYFKYFPIACRILWLSAVIIHALHILIFTYKNLKKLDINNFLPCIFVTYNGIMVSVVIGKDMNYPLVCKMITYYGIVIFTILLPMVLYRIITRDIHDKVYHTQAILLAPSSLCVVSYLNSVATPNKYLLYYLYLAVILALIFVVYKLPKFFEIEFSPGYAGVTFPMAISIVASLKMANYLNGLNIIKQVSGIQLYLATGIIFFVLLKMFSWLKKEVF